MLRLTGGYFSSLFILPLLVASFLSHADFFPKAVCIRIPAARRNLNEASKQGESAVELRLLEIKKILHK